ncbi:hypothetical protein BDZ45DRAFT_742479 [Acephala macrosclerotiorum]|nr:hypothetical protein BDZ45DRAFT_742479 [Acephala macrosclerotiorum]
MANEMIDAVIKRNRAWSLGLYSRLAYVDTAEPSSTISSTFKPDQRSVRNPLSRAVRLPNARYAFKLFLSTSPSNCVDVANPDSDSSFMSICAEELAIAGIGVYIHRDALCLERPGWEVLIAIVGSLIEGHVGSVAMIPLLESSIFSLGKPGTSSAVTF